uniref:Phosphatidic acid phosphatase type 2/haloperoxidase domain-containing protein n=1 Tax=Ascaris suum TaxID=6253 RepID=F1KY03_ASCSU
MQSQSGTPSSSNASDGNTRNIAIGPLIFDCAICAVVAFLFCAIPELAIQPYRRGFFCDDDSIRYPYKGNTIPTFALVFILIAVIIITVAGVETFRVIRLSKNDISVYRLKGRDVHRLFVRFCAYAAHCVLGTLVSVIVCQITKYAVGRLRPHFISVCDPDINMTACAISHEYITDYICNGKSESRIRDARLSFFSGHATTAMCVAVFCVLYLQARLPRRMYGISLLPLFQTILIGGALLIGYSRISDNMHHWSDVLVGFLIGATVGFLSAVYFAQLFKRRNAIYKSEEQLPLVDTELGITNNARRTSAMLSYSTANGGTVMATTCVPLTSERSAQLSLQ